MQAKDAAGIVQEILPGRREGGAAGPPVQEVAVEARLQPLDLVADGRLRQAERLGRTGDAQRARSASISRRRLLSSTITCLSGIRLTAS